MNFILLILLLPLFLFYLILSFIIPIIRLGKIQKEKGAVMYIAKDMIHADYIFLSKDIKNMFRSNKKYVKVGWGDRKIFLETKSWNEVKIHNIIKAFFGLNETVLRVEFLGRLPKNYTKIEISKKQLEIIKMHIENSYNKKKIRKKKEYYQNGDFYESNLKYNCITNCNNWINIGLRLAKISNKIWCPLTFWL